MYEEVVDECPFRFEFVLDCHKIQEMCEKAVSKDPCMLTCLNKYKTPEMCEKAILKDSCMVTCLNKYKTQEMYKKLFWKISLC